MSNFVGLLLLPVFLRSFTFNLNCKAATLYSLFQYEN